jgi:hypothetical protein
VEKKVIKKLVYLSICLLARSCLGAARPRCFVAPGVPLELCSPRSAQEGRKKKGRKKIGFGFGFFVFVKQKN